MALIPFSLKYCDAFSFSVAASITDHAFFTNASTPCFAVSTVFVAVSIAIFTPQTCFAPFAMKRRFVRARPC